MVVEVVGAGVVVVVVVEVVVLVGAIVVIVGSYIFGEFSGEFSVKI